MNNLYLESRVVKKNMWGCFRWFMSVLRKVFSKPAPSIEISAKIAVGRIPGRATQGRRPDFPVKIVPAMWYGIGCGIIEASCVIGVAITAPCTAEMKK